jgi:hypothetical protein
VADSDKNGQPAGAQCCWEGSLIANSPIQNLDQCPDRISNGTAPVFNGCTGVPFDNPNLFSNCGAPLGEGPNRPSFVTACNGHDICYDTCKEPKTTCDTDFRQGLLAICEQVPLFTCKIDCIENANAMTVIVTSIPNFYTDAQVNVCNCCQ